ncbi:hypothetical protein, partial [uncultured Bacteroides sp.]|uniref:hypothetical protein n=1 Tax=uncultured Bacteroides sp. TaxID=162156 RepID=UPI002591AFC4
EDSNTVKSAFEPYFIALFEFYRTAIIPIIDMRKVAEAGKFKIMVGTDSQNGLETFFEVK